MNTTIIKTKEEWIEFLNKIKVSHNVYIPEYARQEAQSESQFPCLVVWYVRDNPNHIEDFIYEIFDQFEVQDFYDQVFNFVSRSKGIPL